MPKRSWREAVKRLKVRYRAEALADVRDVYLWVLEASGDAETARRFAERILEACEKIGGRPMAGRARDDLAPGLRTFPFERRGVIAYLVEDAFVEITNVFYGGRDYEALYEDPRQDGLSQSPDA